VPYPPALSQISAIAEAQCAAREAPMQDLPEAYHMGGKIPDLQGGLVLRKCDPTVSRKIDLLIMSIGGNDIGFARLVANAVLADQSNLKKLGGWFGQVHGLKEAQTQLEVLDERYKSLNRALHNILHIPWEENDRVILTGYPRLALLDDGRSHCPDGTAGMDVLPDFRLSAAKADEGDKGAERLNSVMKKSAREHGWSFVDKHRAMFQGRGLCAGFTDSAFSIADDLRLPRKIAGEWVPYNPADYRPYASRQRWFRTPNDAFMTGNFHVSQTVLQTALKSDTLSWVQIMLAATYSGAFHPSAEGHAAMADAVVERARAVIAKYRGRSG
jgi:GDSL-like Lipase/Acylhydrolase family